ncbi:MAG: hypothetical protein HYZ49_00135 [Chloroflexi bacterium]|nr:hypothetical protein [Chloroflexota bacterium]
MALAGSRHLIIACDRCGRAAAEFSLLPASVKGEGLWQDRDRLERTDFIGAVTKFGGAEELTALFEALRSGDYEAACRFDIDFVAFHCWSCGKSYCEACWQIGPPVFDEGFYDYTLGTCPEGHEQTVDD